MTTDPTEAATRARMAERTAFARGARMGSDAESAAVTPLPPGTMAKMARMQIAQLVELTKLLDTLPNFLPSTPPPPPPHVEQSSPSINPLAALGRLISGVNVPPAVAGVTRALLEAAAVGALSKAASLLAVAHVPVEYAALAAAGVMVLRAIEGVIDQWGKG